MNKTLDYYSHITTTPPYYQRDYEHDLPKERNQGKNEVSWISTGKRVLLLTIPFFSLYKPFGVAISATMGSFRCITHINGTIDAAQKKDITATAQQMTQVAFAVAALAGSILNFTLGLILTNGGDCVFSVVEAAHCLAAGKYEESGENLLQGVSSAFYLAIIFTGNLEIIFLSIALQSLLSFHHARKELSEQRYPEAIAKILMGAIRGYQACDTLSMIQKRNDLCTLHKEFENFLVRAKNGKKVDHLLDSPLIDLQEKIEERQVLLSDAKEKEYNFGSYFHGFGKGAVKGANLNFRTSLIDGKKVTELDFKINHVFRDRLAGLIKDLQSMKKDDLHVLLASSNSHVKDIKISKAPFEISQILHLGDAYKITFEGLGNFYVGSSTLYPNLYDRVIVRLDEGKNLYELHEMLSFVHLDEALKVSHQEDILRLKMGQLFRTFYPKEATPFERSEAFFHLPIESLKQEMIKKAPGMGDIFQEHLDRMEERELLPGKIRYAIPGLAEKAYSLGARTLTAAVTGVYTNEALFCRVASMLKMGMFSSETRYTNGIPSSGLSTFSDFYTGSADSVFTQMITEKNCKDHMPFSHLIYNTKVRLLISLDALESSTYQYHFDAFGSRRSPSYDRRPAILDFVKTQNTRSSSDHEVMIKDRVPPSMIKGLVVQNTQMRDDLLKYLRDSHIVQKDAKNSETILGIDVDRFIQIGTCASEKLLIP